MSYPILQRGYQGAAVERLQLQLNKVGAMLHADSDFGPATERGVRYAEDIAQLPLTGITSAPLWQWLENQPLPFSPLHIDGIAFIAREVTGGMDYYDLVTRWPHFPGHASGIVIGVGYDLRIAAEHEFIENWSHHLPWPHIEELRRDIGKKGSKRRAEELRNLGIEIPFKSAWSILVNITLPQYYRLTRSVYPALPSLPDLCQAALVSLIFNRGTRLSGHERQEMREIQFLLRQTENQQLTASERKNILYRIEDLFLSMKRLWSPGSGLIKRRQEEANLWRRGVRQLEE